MTRKKLMLTVLMSTSLAGFTLAKEAQAFTVSNPYGNQGVSVTVGTDATFGAIVCYTLNSNANVFTAYSLGSTTSLNDNYLITSGSGHDFVRVVSSGSSPVCGGYVLNPLVYGSNRRLDVSTAIGNDIILCGAGLSDCFGDQDVDDLQTFSAVGTIFGGSGDDFLFGSSAIATDRLSAGSGNDCMTDPGNAHNLFDCGTANDKFVSPASGAISCETPVPFC